MNSHTTSVAKNSVKPIFLTPHIIPVFSFTAAEAAANITVLWALVNLVAINNSIAEKQQYILFLFLALAASYLLKGIASYCAELWRQGSIASFMQLAATELSNKPTRHNDQTLKEKLISGMSGNSIDIISGINQFYQDFLHSCVHLVFSLILLSNYMGSQLYIAFFISFLLCFALIRKTQTPLSQKSEKAERRRLGISKIINNGWDNLVIGNARCHQSWWHHAFTHIKKYRRASLNATRYSLSTHLGLIFLAHIPAVMVVLYQLQTTQGNNTAQLEIIVLIPGLVRALNLLSQTAAMSTSFNMLRGQLNVLRDYILPIKDTELSNRIDINKISINNQNFPPHQSIKDWIQALPTHGRLSLRGANGSGKTSLMLTIKHFFQKQAFYLPHHSQLFLGTRMSTASTGEKIARQLDAITKDQSIKVLILDEWDANLDQENRKNISSRLDELSKEQFLIIESLHHSPVTEACA